MEKARAQQADIVLFPELTIPGYLLGDLWEQNAFLRDCEAWGKELIAASKDLCIVFGNIALDPEKINEDGRIRKYNAAFVPKTANCSTVVCPTPLSAKLPCPTTGNLTMAGISTAPPSCSWNCPGPRRSKSCSSP